MKKYKLREEVKKYFDTCYYKHELSLEDWKKTFGLSLEALEEVPQRVELKGLDNDNLHIPNFALYKNNNESWTQQEKDLCEKALNNELLDIDNLDDDDFESWYLNTCDLTFPTVSIKAVLKAYLEQRNK